MFLKRSLSVILGGIIFLLPMQSSLALFEASFKSTVLLEVLASKDQYFYGTGIIMSIDGFILTAAHVVMDETTGAPVEYVNICTIEKEYSIPKCKYSGRVLAYNADYDLALITIGYELDENFEEVGEYIGPDNSESLKLPYVDFGDYLPSLGDKVTFLGFPGTSSSVTLTQGVISSFELLEEDVIGNYITDAIINPGNSGGPAYNEDEKVIGIVTAVTLEEVGGNYGIVISTNKILFWFLDLVDQGILNEEFVSQIFSNDQIEEVSDGKVSEGKEIFTDVTSLSPNGEAINYLKSRNIVKGYEDGSFKPQNHLNRAELLKILVEGAGYSPDETQYKNCFPDVKTDWYAKYVCFAKEKGWIQGYPDNTFRPANSINKAEAIKMLLETFDVDLVQATENPYSDTSKDEWFGKYINTAKIGGLLEENGDKYYPAEKMTRGQISENIFRLLEEREKVRFFTATEESFCEMMKVVKNNPKATFDDVNNKDIEITKKYGFDPEKPETIDVLVEKYKNDPDYLGSVDKAIEKCGGEELFNQVINLLQ